MCLTDFHFTSCLSRWSIEVEDDAASILFIWSVGLVASDDATQCDNEARSLSHMSCHNGDMSSLDQGSGMVLELQGGVFAVPSRVG